MPTGARRRVRTTSSIGRTCSDPTGENGLALFRACDNLRKGAALNAIQIAEYLLRALAFTAPEAASPTARDD